MKARQLMSETKYKVILKALQLGQKSLTMDTIKRWRCDAVKKHLPSMAQDPGSGGAGSYSVALAGLELPM